ncbi:MAG TPA: Gfo/Idh/MocA family oxidoreductase [Candidatus Hydrogenedentes bacterium]|jgi:predicted dehydrogenase|nr:Gfo/Idh/MocA family oxidoreductase [Candidatus Hydrogenedentota bacterium]HPK24043.1 Gfo/Idh/MocA family oxidoreductase [Candidatus Hydrogenedentota bacterium]
MMNKKSETTRRDFMKNAAVLASAAVAGAAVPRNVRAAGSDIIRIGMIGCGSRCTGAAVEALTADPGTRLVAMCDVIPDRIQEKRKRLTQQFQDRIAVDDDHCFAGLGGYRHVIEASDVVLIACAAKFHPWYALQALEAGKHVFVEKPHGIDPLGIQTLKKAAALAEEKKLCLVSGLQSRYHSGYAETIQRIYDGDIGEIISFEENFLRAPYAVTQREPWMSELQWQCSTQYHFTWLSGDDVPQSLVHNLDRVSWVMHDVPPLKCHGLGGRSTMTDHIYGTVFDHHSVVYEYENGVKVFAFCRTTDNCFNDNSSIVYGTKGKASLLGTEIWGDKAWKWKGSCNPYQVEHDVLFRAIRSGEPVNNGAYMAQSTLMGIMGQISCYTGEEIYWDKISQSDFSFGPRPEACNDDMEPPVLPGEDGSYPTFRPGITKLLG